MNRYIDADLMKQSIPNTKMDEFENCRYCRLLDEEQVKDLIDAQPTADVRENVKGEWIWNPDGMDWGIGAWVCSECGSKPETWWESDKSIAPLRCSGSSYCPNCGADMRGKK